MMNRIKGRNNATDITLRVRKVGMINYRKAYSSRGVVNAESFLYDKDIPYP
jgi:hypothetical protein